MKAKTFFILVCICGVLAAAAFFMYRQDRPAARKTQMGKKFFDALPVNEIASIAVSSRDGTVTLKKGPDHWVVEDRYGYPADFAKITDLVKKLRDAKIGRSFNAADDVLARLALYPPAEKKVPESQQGTRVVFKDNQGKTLADVMMAPAADRTGVYYLMHAGRPIIYLVDKNFRFLEKKPAGWLVKEIVDLNEKDIARIACYPAGGQKAVYTIVRPAKDKDAALLAVPEGKKVETYKIEQMLGILSALKIEDVVDPARKLAAAVFSDQPRFEYHLFNGTVYSIHPGTSVKGGSDNHYLKISLAGPSPAVDGKTDAPEAKDKTAESVRPRTPKLDAWTYVVSKWVYNSFLTRPDDFFEKAKQK